MSFEDHLANAMSNAFKYEPPTRDDMQAMFERMGSWGLRPSTTIMHPRQGFDLLMWDDDWAGPHGTRWGDLTAAFMSWDGAVSCQEYIDEIKAYRKRRQQALKKQLRRKKKGHR
jgi:hypothetical protein